jgi:hypothetical protein
MLVLTVVGALLAVQGEATGQQPSQAKPKEATVAPNGREIALPVTGLSKKSVAAVREDLLRLSTRVYICSACEFESSEAACTKCRAALKPESRALFTSVAPSMQENLIAVTLDPRVVVRLSQIESALARRKVKIDNERFTLPGDAQLLVQAPFPDDGTIDKALDDAKLFEEFDVVQDPATNQFAVTVRAKKNAPTRVKVAAALAEAKGRLIDIVWSPSIAQP